MAKFHIKLTQEQIDTFILDEMIESFRLVERDIARLYEKSKTKMDYSAQWEDLEDQLDLRTHLKATIKYITIKSQREKLGLHF